MTDRTDAGERAETPREQPAAAQRSTTALALLVGAVAFLAAALLASNELGGFGGDDAEYLLLARSIREHGAYMTTWAPGPPTAHTLYPPVLPLLLVPFAGGAQPAFFAAHLLLAAVGGVATAILTLLFARRGLPPVAAAAGALAAALSPIWLRCASDVLSELPSLAFVAGSLLALATPGDERRTSRRMAVAAALAAAAFLTRTAAVALVPWVVLALVLPRRGGGRAGWLSAAGLCAVVGGWFSYGAAAGGGGTYFGVLARGEGSGGGPLVERMVQAFTGEYLPGLPSILFPSWGAFWDVCGVAFWALAATGLVAGVVTTRRLRAPEGWLLLSLAMLCAWSHRDPRFGVALVPFLVLLALEGVAAIVRRAAPTAVRRAVVATAIACVLPNAIFLVRITYPRAFRPTPPVPGIPATMPLPAVARFYDTWTEDDASFEESSGALASYLLLCKGLREDPNAPTGPLLAANPRVAALISGRQAFTPEPGETTETTLERMRAAGADLLLVDSFVSARSSAVREVIRRHSDKMEQVGEVGTAYLFRLRPR